MLCPYCAEEIQDQARKCRHCGKWLVKPDASGAVTGSMPFEASTFVPTAGTAGLPASADAPPVAGSIAVKNRSKRKRITIIVAVALLVIGGGVAALMLLPDLATRRVVTDERYEYALDQDLMTLAQVVDGVPTYESVEEGEGTHIYYYDVPDGQPLRVIAEYLAYLDNQGYVDVGAPPDMPPVGGWDRLKLIGSDMQILIIGHVGNRVLISVSDR